MAANQQRTEEDYLAQATLLELELLRDLLLVDGKGWSDEVKDCGGVVED
jgi:hypothetical protein